MKIKRNMSIQGRKNISLAHKGKLVSLETREKMRIAKLGTHQSQETIRRRFASRRGYRHSQETKEKLRLAREGYKLWANREHPKGMLGKSSSKKGKTFDSFYGLNKSEEIKNKIRSKVSLNYKQNPEILEKIRIARAKQITPLNDTSIEIKIQNFLRELGIDFFTHQYMNQIEHSYQCDILIPSMNLVVECDGNYWHKYPVGLEKDHIRTKELIEKGFKVLRLWESEINEMDIEDFKIRLVRSGNEEAL